ncbi:lysozyme family protein [Lactovum miscens]|uniref:CwlT-like lysozyme domain-containing protein n=1 Tax=Lactovum miscens TaxID=190387 RepID=A0A841C9T9_9LACT|nr:lysozyme family protein [Lactovum miscens]MBB5888352.1 hypothetical protein [Lactovum miscens]
MIKKLLSLLVIVGLAFGGFYAYKTHKDVKNVETYSSIVNAELEKDGLPSSDKNLVLAIIYQETKGGEVDVMQSSESVSGTTNTTNDSTASIQNGVAHLADMLTYAQSKSVDVWTAVQAYNFGKSYIDYIASNGGKNTLDLAAKYSKEVVAPSLGNGTGETYQHLNIMSFFYNGGKLYRNGGNLFYAQEVYYKMNLMSWFNW